MANSELFNMFPSSFASSIEYSPYIHAQMCGDCRARFRRSPDIANHFFCELGMIKLCAPFYFSQANLDGPTNVFSGKYVFQIIGTIIYFVAIFVIHLMPIGEFSKESRSHKAMHKKEFLFDMGRTYQANCPVASAIQSWLNYAWIWMAFYTAPVQAAYSALSRRFIKFPIWNRMPFFNAILEFIHDKFLLRRNWLWLEPFGCAITCSARFILADGGEQ